MWAEEEAAQTEPVEPQRRWTPELAVPELAELELAVPELAEPEPAAHRGQAVGGTVQPPQCHRHTEEMVVEPVEPESY